MIGKHTARGTIRLTRLFAIALVLVGLSGCWNGDVSNIRLANISLGQQLIDLKRALEEDAISEAEYASSREKLISLYAICEQDEEE